MRMSSFRTYDFNNLFYIEYYKKIIEVSANLGAHFHYKMNYPKNLKNKWVLSKINLEKANEQ